MFCSNCGNKLPEGAKFCSVCGAKVPETAEQSLRTTAETGFGMPNVRTEVPDVSGAVKAEAPAAPAREKMSFDWSDFVDEPHKKEIKEIRSPWEATGSIDEKELYAEMTPSTDRSRTMSFIDVLKAEKEEKEKTAADKAVEYTEVLHVDPDLSAFEEPPTLHYAPLYEDVDEPVRTPFDRPDKEVRPAYEDEPRFETSRDTIADFDKAVKGFERGAGISEEPVFETPKSSAGAGACLPS